MASRIGLIALLIYGALALRVVTAVSTGGDEPLYLLYTHSLWADGDLDVGDNLLHGDYVRFYWGAGAPVPQAHPFVAFPALLLPGYALLTTLLPGWPLAGRLGAVLTIAVCGALLAAQSYRLCRDLGASRPASAWTAVLGALTPPVLVHANHVYPEIPAALAVVVAVRIVLRLPARAWPGLPALAGLALMLVAFKDRYTPLALGLSVWAIVRLGSRWPRVRMAGLAALGAAATAVVAFDPWAGLFPNLRPFPTLGAPPVLVRATLGVFADQEFGLLAWAPHWTLAVVGLPWLWRRRRDVVLGLGALLAGHLAALVAYRWVRWYGGVTPAARFVLTMTPLLSPFVATAFDHVRGRGLATVMTVCLTWSILVAAALAAVPAWRYDPPDGQARLLQMLGRALDLDLARFLPSLLAPTWWTWLVLGIGVIGLVAGSRAAAAGLETGNTAWAGHAVLLPGRHALGLVVGLGALWLGAAATLPTWSVPAAAMTHTGGAPVEDIERVAPLWLLTRDAALEARVIAWSGATEVSIDAAAYSTTGVAPRLSVALGSASAELGPLRAGPDRFVPGRYVVRLPSTYGGEPLRVALTGLVDDQATGRFQHAYVERVRLGRAGTTAEPEDCRTEPYLYCPTAPVSRAELAVLLLRARQGWTFEPPPATGVFDDVPADHWAAAWIEAVTRDGLIASCGDARYCPDQDVTRAELAPVLLRALYGRGWAPSPAEGRFVDVPADRPEAPWIEVLGRDRLTCGCGGGRYCPADILSWEQLGGFLGRAFPGSYPRTVQCPVSANG
jgi:hypothetical protein